MLYITAKAVNNFSRNQNVLMHPKLPYYRAPWNSFKVTDHTNNTGSAENDKGKMAYAQGFTEILVLYYKLG